MSLFCLYNLKAQIKYHFLEAVLNLLPVVAHSPVPPKTHYKFIIVMKFTDHFLEIHKLQDTVM